jgi:hypothetical protein
MVVDSAASSEASPGWGASVEGRCLPMQGIDNVEIIETVHARSTPMIPVNASRRP